MFFFLLSLLSLWVGLLPAIATPSGTSQSRRQELPSGPARPNETDCYNVIVRAEQGVRIFWASDVFNCLKNVPFNKNVANQFIDYYNHTLQYQSTLAFLADPPKGYQQPAVNVQQVLQGIKANISAGLYTTQYVFETEIQLLINRMHDSHVALDAGILAPFSFSSPYGLVSASIDGEEAPKVYLQEDVVSSQFEGWSLSHITHINGEKTADYLTKFAELNSRGYLEPHADWNALMDSPAAYIQGSRSTFQLATFYSGDELNFTFANGSELNSWWWAIYSESARTGPLRTARDFFNYFVLGKTPEGFDPTVNATWWLVEDNLNSTLEENDNDNSPNPNYGCSKGNHKLQNWCLDSQGAYPNDPIVAQEDLTIPGSGAVTGYILDDISTGVLSIPSFYQTSDRALHFTQAVDKFIRNATSRRTSRVIIDLQGNDGGMVLLALTTFKQFFNQLDPYVGSRIRSHESAKVLGTAYSRWWKSLEHGKKGAFDPYYQSFADSEWVIGSRISDITGKNFSSWLEYYGPVKDHGDSFSRTQLYNLSDPTLDVSIFGWNPEIYTEPRRPAPLRWAPEDIVILTDGLCSSACAMFVELMAHQAGVRTISVGGRPITGPMQTASGNRGARAYNSRFLAEDYESLNDVVKDYAAYDLLPRPRIWNNTGMFVNYAAFNIRDQMRKNDHVPLQFKYDAAQCRIYYTLQNVYNMSQLWRDVAAATWENTFLCVQDSRGYATGPNTRPIKEPPKRTAQLPTLDLDIINDVDSSIISTNGLVAARYAYEFSYQSCDKRISNCPESFSCETVPANCPGGHTSSVDVCVSLCYNIRPTCTCIPRLRSESKMHLPGRHQPRAANTKVSLYQGYCDPGYLNARQYGATCPF